MSYSMIAAIFLATLAVSLSGPVFDNERNFLVRFYSDFAQVYRPALLKSFNEERTLEQYKFYFTEKEYARIPEESLGMLYTNVIERTVTYYSTPNFVVNGSRYLYIPDLAKNVTYEIELVNPDDLLFRDVSQPNRYFYLTSFDELIYIDQVPVMPYYEVTFLCNTSSTQTQAPLLSYIDRGFRFATRYVLDVPPVGTSQQVELQAYADILYTGDQPIVIKGAELLTGDINLNAAPMDCFRTNFSFDSTGNSAPSSVNDSVETSVSDMLGQNATGTYIYELSLPSPLSLPGHSLKSIRFLKTNVTVKPFLYYSSSFVPNNCYGKVVSAYNLTSLDNFLPYGHLISREQGRYFGQVDLPNLPIDETHTIINEPDAEVSYNRQVTVVQEDDNNDSITYYVEYNFQNTKPLQDVQVYFVESFGSFENFQVQNISISTQNPNLQNVDIFGTDLRGYIFVPHQSTQTTFSYNLIVNPNV